jgi:hypothetical protein
MYQIDNAVAKMGLTNMSQGPSAKQQREAFERMKQFAITNKDQIFHIVSMDWYKSWVDLIGGMTRVHPGPINSPGQL